MSKRGSGAAACSVARLSNRIDDITGLNIKVGDYLQHYKSGYIYIYIYIFIVVQSGLQSCSYLGGVFGYFY
jgi:hypothetical protein